MQDPSKIWNTQVGKSPVSIGRYTYGVENITIRQFGEGAALSIGSFCSLAWNIQIFLGGYHRTDWCTTYPFGHIFVETFSGSEIVGHPHTKGNCLIGNDVWIGAGVTIMSGVTIADGAVIAANSHVVSDVAPYEIVGGNKAQHIKFRFNKEIINDLLELAWWDFPPDKIRLIAPLLCQPPTRQLLQEIRSRIV